MSAQKAIDWCRERGVFFELEGDDLVVVGAEHLSEKAIDRLREIKSEIIETLFGNDVQCAENEESPSIDYRLLQAIADARNDNAEQCFGTDRFCKCGQFASTQWRVDGKPTWFCDECK